MEVWLESLSMHLSVGMPLPPDLVFDIQQYRGLSPSSSGSTTPEGGGGHRSPAPLEPIKEGRAPPTIQVSSSADNLRTVVDSNNFSDDDKLSKKGEFSKRNDKLDVNSDKRFPVVELRKVPKNFTNRNKYACNDTFLTDDSKKVSLRNIEGAPSRVTQKYVNIVQKKPIPDLVSSTLSQCPLAGAMKPSTFNIDRNIFESDSPDYSGNLSLSRRRCMRETGTPVLQRHKVGNTAEKTPQGGNVKNIVAILNKKKDFSRGDLGRCSLRVMGKFGGQRGDEFRANL